MHPVSDDLHRIYRKTTRREARALKTMLHLLILLRTSANLGPNSSKFESEPNLGGNIPAYWVSSQWQSTVRLLDPPLHEFLPHGEDEVKRISESSGISRARLLERADELHETNPMLGFRGCRLLVCYPEIVEMQARAMFEAAVECERSGNVPVQLEIMIPLVVTKRELELVKGSIDATAAAVVKETGLELKYRVGTMVEVPRAALRATELAELAEFFSFGTNDLTQTTIGLSRDDAGSYLGSYVSRGVFEKDPFVSIDVEGVGELVRIGAKRGRAHRRDIKLGMCGEHAGDPQSIAFCERIGLDYVSCSAFRIPVARLAAAQASIRQNREATSLIESVEAPIAIHA